MWKKIPDACKEQTDWESVWKNTINPSKNDLGVWRSHKNYNWCFWQRNAPNWIFVSRSGKFIDLQGSLADLQEFILHEPGMKCTAKWKVGKIIFFYWQQV